MRFTFFSDASGTSISTSLATDGSVESVKEKPVRGAIIRSMQQPMPQAGSTSMLDQDYVRVDIRPHITSRRRHVPLPVRYDTPYRTPPSRPPRPSSTTMRDVQAWLDTTRVRPASPLVRHDEAQSLLANAATRSQFTRIQSVPYQLRSTAAPQPPSPLRSEFSFPAEPPSPMNRMKPLPPIPISRKRQQTGQPLPLPKQRRFIKFSLPISRDGKGYRRQNCAKSDSFLLRRALSDQAPRAGIQRHRSAMALTSPPSYDSRGSRPSYQALTPPPPPYKAYRHPSRLSEASFGCVDGLRDPLRDILREAFFDEGLIGFQGRQYARMEQKPQLTGMERVKRVFGTLKERMQSLRSGGRS